MTGKGIQWTVGMAVYDTQDGGYESMRACFTAMSISIHHNFVGEIIIVDNNPQQFSPLKAFCMKMENCRYIEMPTPQGTSPPRNKVFELASCPFVCCIDPHVLLFPGTFEAMTGFYARRGLECFDLLHGKMMTEKKRVMATHMNDRWRADMLGVWGRAFSSSTGRLFSTVEKGDKVEYVTLGQEEGEQRPLTESEVAGYRLPAILNWAGHEGVLLKTYRCSVPQDPFRIPGHGMGFFACRKDAWLPFHPAARGFGGEEMTTGYRYRKAGRHCWCIPGAKWWHHFEKGGSYALGTAYPLRLCDRVRNYLLEFARLGLDFTPIKEHFGDRIPPDEWEQLVLGKELPQRNAVNRFEATEEYADA